MAPIESKTYETVLGTQVTNVLSSAGDSYQIARSKLGQKIIEQSPKDGGGWLPVSLHRLDARPLRRVSWAWGASE